MSIPTGPVNSTPQYDNNSNNGLQPLVDPATGKVILDSNNQPVLGPSSEQAKINSYYAIKNPDPSEPLQPFIDPATGKTVIDPNTGQPKLVTAAQQAFYNGSITTTVYGNPISGDTPVDHPYVASPQFAVLQKPLEQKPEKKDAEKAVATGTSDQQPTGDSTQVGSQQHTQEQQQDGQSSGGGAGGGSSGSDSGGSGSGTSSGGDQSGSGSGSGSRTVILEGANQAVGVSATAGVGAASGVNRTDTVQTAEQAYALALDPTGTAVITASGLYSPPANPGQFFSNSGKMMQEITAMAAKFAESLPAGPDKMRFMDFLKMIQNALTQFQQLLREITMKDSKGAVDRSKAALETSLAKIEKQRKEQAEMARKSEEAAKKAKLMQALAPLFIILMIFLLPLLLPLMIGIMMPLVVMVMALIVAEIVDQCATAAGVKPFAIKALADALMAVVEALVDISANALHFSDEARKTAKLVFKMIVVALILVVSTLVAPLAILGGGITALMSFLTATKVIKNAAMASGMDEGEAEKVDMYVGIAIGAIAAIATLGLALVMPGAQGGIIASVSNAAKTILKAAFDLITKIINIIVNLIDKVAGKAAQTVKAVLKAVLDPEMLLQITMMGVQTTSAVATYQQQSLLAEIALIHGRMDSEVELKDATIQMLKKMIKQLLDGLNSIGDDMASIAQSLKKTHTGVSDITTNLFA